MASRAQKDLLERRLNSFAAGVEHNVRVFRTQGSGMSRFDTGDTGRDAGASSPSLSPKTMAVGEREGVVVEDGEMLDGVEDEEDVDMEDDEMEDSEVTISVPASPDDKGDGRVATSLPGSQAPVVGSTSEARTSTWQGSQQTCINPALLVGATEARGSTSVNNPNNANNANNKVNNSNGKTPSSLHDLSAASYLARHQSKTAQNRIAMPDTPQSSAAAAAVSLAPSLSLTPTPSPAAPPKTQTLSLDNRAHETQFLEQRFQHLWTRREAFLKTFTQTHKLMLKYNPKEEEKEEKEKEKEDDDKRKDSIATAPPPTTTTTSTPNQIQPLRSTTTPRVLTAVRTRALETLLEAWYSKLGASSPDGGWTKYNDKTSTLARLTLRSILSQGDPDLGIPIKCLPSASQDLWNTKLRNVKWWFTSVNQAVDFLSAFGIEKGRFGSEISRVEVLQFSRVGTGGVCLSPDHAASERAWKAGVAEWAPNVFPPDRYCPCSEYKLLMKILGNARGLPEPASVGSIKTLSNELTRDWQAANLAAGIDVARDWPGGVGEGYMNLPSVVSFGEESGEFELWHYLGRDEEKGLLLRAVRLEGPFAGLL